MRGRAFVLLFSFGNGAEMLSADRDEGQGFYFFLCFSGIDSGKLSADRDEGAKLLRRFPFGGNGANSQVLIGKREEKPGFLLLSFCSNGYEMLSADRDEKPAHLCRYLIFIAYASTETH